MRAVAYVNKFLRAKGGGGNNFKNLDSLLGLKPVLVPRKFLGRFTPLVCPSICAYVRPSTKSFFDFNEIWHVGRGRWVMHDSM